MSEIVEYFTRHYSLVIDNDQGTYNAAQDVVRSVLTDSDVSLTEYLGMDEAERNKRFADDIGTRILELVEEWVSAALGERTDPGTLLIREAMALNGGSLAYALGKHYMPENSEASEYLSDDE